MPPPKPDLCAGDVARTAAGCVVTVTRWLNDVLLMAIVLRNQAGDGRWLVGCEHVFLIDELIAVD